MVVEIVSAVAERVQPPSKLYVLRLCSDISNRSEDPSNVVRQREFVDDALMEPAGRETEVTDRLRDVLREVSRDGPDRGDPGPSATTEFSVGFRSEREPGRCRLRDADNPSVALTAHLGRGRWRATRSDPRPTLDRPD